jgi:hypothetical protein
MFTVSAMCRGLSCAGQPLRIVFSKCVRSMHCALGSLSSLTSTGLGA